MPPDLNSVPRSPKPPTASTPRVQATSPGRAAPLPNPAPFSNSHAITSPIMPHVPTTTGEEGSVSSGPGPMRHPRPLTAADLHLLLEQEQEGIVNRLTRELSTLRAQTASAASNASSTSSLAVSASNESYGNSIHSHIHPPPHQHSFQTPTPTSARRHRSSSSLSGRSGRSATGQAAGASAGATSVSGVAPAREPPPTATSSSRPSVDLTRDQRPTVSRQSSTRSEMRAPQSHIPSHATPTGYSHGHGHSHRQSLTSQHAVGSAATGPGGLASPTARYEELVAQREELEALKRENDGLKRRIKELEVERRNSSNETPAETISTADDTGRI